MATKRRSPPEPITQSDFRRAAITRLGIVAFFFVGNVAARFHVAANEPDDLADYDLFLGVSTACHVVIAAVNGWALARTRTRELRAWRATTYASAACESMAVVLGLWLSGSHAISFNVLWCLLLIGTYRVYFDAALGRFVLAAICGLEVALVVLQNRGVLSMVPLHAGALATAPPTASAAFALMRLLGASGVVFVLATFTARRIRGSENALRELNEQLEERVSSQVSLLERAGRLRRYLAPQLVAKIVDSAADPVSVRERRHLTLMFADLRGFTALVEHADPDVVADVLNTYFDEVSTIAFSHGGTIDKFIGDAVMVFFGAPEATGDRDQALRCVRMAIEIQARMQTLGPLLAKRGGVAELSARIGIASGVATVGSFGTRHRADFTAVGPPVNRAARLEPLAPPGGILVDGETRALLGDECELEARGEVLLKGFAAPARTYLVVGLTERGEDHVLVR